MTSNSLISILQIIENAEGVKVTPGSGVCNSLNYTAPELIHDRPILHCASDVYAYSMTVFEVRGIKNSTQLYLTNVVKDNDEEEALYGG